jgi:hypothetical protein
MYGFKLYYVRIGWVTCRDIFLIVMAGFTLILHFICLVFMCKVARGPKFENNVILCGILQVYYYKLS